MKSIAFKITNPHGLISRRAAELVSVANRFTSNIFLKTEKEEPADLKSIMNVFDTIIEANDTVTIEIEGSDEDKAYDAYQKLLESDVF